MIAKLVCANSFLFEFKLSLIVPVLGMTLKWQSIKGPGCSS